MRYGNKKHGPVWEWGSIISPRFYFTISQNSFYPHILG
nr:MAG TPA: hypothetical protein [Caudoviricetes sp.]